MQEVKYIEKATHWMPIKDTHSKLAHVTENKMYEFLLDDEDELVIIDDNGTASLAYLVIKGKLFNINK